MCGRMHILCLSGISRTDDPNIQSEPAARNLNLSPWALLTTVHADQSLLTDTLLTKVFMIQILSHSVPFL